MDLVEVDHRSGIIITSETGPSCMRCIESMFHPVKVVF